MQRVSVIGSSGAGKTTLARELAQRLGLPHVELDAIYHQPGWVPLPQEVFQQRARELAAGERWVVDGNYNSHGVAQILWARADTIVWIDLPRWRVMTQVVPRTLRRIFTREELWNGNRERLHNLFERRPDENVILWAWTRHAAVRSRYAHMQGDGTWAGRRVARLRSRGEIAQFLAQADTDARTRSA